MLRLPNGRRLGYSVTGPADGLPVLYCHGAIGTSVQETVDLGALVQTLGIRYIAPWRPGMGGSDPVPDRTLLGFAQDVRVLADELELERFAVVGVSAGGPHALAIGHLLRGRVSTLALCSSLSPLYRPHQTPGLQRRIRLALRLLAERPRLFRVAGDLLLPLAAANPRLIMRVIEAHAAAGERARLAGERSAAVGSFLDATGGGVGGLIQDYLSYAGSWGFDPTGLEAEVHLWHGAQDPLVPVEHALQLAVSLPRSRVFIDPGEGHHFFRSRLGEILAVLIGREPALDPQVRTTLAGASELVAQAAARRSLTGGRSTSRLSTAADGSRPGDRKLVGSGPSRRPSR